MSIEIENEREGFISGWAYLFHRNGITHKILPMALFEAFLIFSRGNLSLTHNYLNIKVIGNVLKDEWEVSDIGLFLKAKVDKNIIKDVKDNKLYCDFGIAYRIDNFLYDNNQNKIIQSLNIYQVTLLTPK